MKEIITVAEIVRLKMAPVTKRQLLGLIQNGEHKKNGELKHSVNYILGTNLGIGGKRARWGVELSELEAWAERAKGTFKRDHA